MTCSVTPLLLDEEKDPELLKLFKIGLQGHDAPELGRPVETAAGVQHKLAGGGSHRAQLDDVELARERYLEDAAGEVQLNDDLGLYFNEGFVEQVGRLQDHAARKFDEE